MKTSLFLSRLEAQWAVFFTLAGWEWEYKPPAVHGWRPHFKVSVPCGHSECSGSHELLVEIQPYSSVEQFEGHPGRKYPYGHDMGNAGGHSIPADASAVFGTNPSVTHWEMVHGSGGGQEEVELKVDDWPTLWKRAGHVVDHIAIPINGHR